MNHLKSFFMKSIGSITLLHLFSLITLSWMQGSSRQTISGTFWILSSLVNVSSLGTASIGIGLWYVIKYFFKSAPLTLGIPTLMATCSYGLNSSSKQSTMLSLANGLLHVGLPLSLITLFVGYNGINESSLYPLYWLIPVALWSLNRYKIVQSELAFALSSTFIAHAVGSIITMLLIPFSPAQWFALIPIVAVERLVLASGQVLTLHFVRFAIKHAQNIMTYTFHQQTQ